jgi:hypothetical protein
MDVTMRVHWQIFAAVLFFNVTPSLAEDAVNEVRPQEADTDLLALMSGRCSILNVAGRDFACKTVAWAHSTHGRAYFTIALDDPADHHHIISFSGANGRRTTDQNLYELPVDRMLLNSKHRPKVDGLPVAFVESGGNVPAAWKLRVGAGLEHCLFRNRQIRQEVRVAFRVGRLAYYIA